LGDSYPTFDRQVEATQSIATQRIGTALHNNSAWAIVLHDLFKNGLEDILVAPIINSIKKWKVDTVVLAIIRSNILVRHTHTHKYEQEHEQRNTMMRRLGSSLVDIHEYHQFQGNSHHIYETIRTLLDQSCKKLLQLHHRGEHRYRYTVLVHNTYITTTTTTTATIGQ
jgi:hypothetical protein